MKRKGYFHTKASRRNMLEGYLMTAPLMLGCILFFAAPLGVVIARSFGWGVASTWTIQGLQNYVKLFSNELFLQASKNTAKFLLISIPLNMVIAFSVALMLRKHVEKFKVLKSVLLLPYIMPVVGTVLMVDVIYSKTGLINSLLLALGVPVVDWLTTDHAFGVVVLLYLWKNVGYSIILLLAGLVTISEDNYDAASMDGASRWQKFMHITIPQMWYSIFFAAAFSLINAFKCFREIFLIGGVHPDESIYMLQHFINNAFKSLNYSKLAAASTLMFVVLAGIFAVCYQFVLRKEAYKE